MNAREYFRIDAPARVALRAVAPDEEEAARLRVRARHTPGFDPRSLEEARAGVEQRALLDVLGRIALLLERVDRRLDELGRLWISGERGPLIGSEPVRISLSGSGFSGVVPITCSPGALFEAHLDLWESGLPLIASLARLVRVDADGGRAFAFEEILPADRERIVQLAVRRQSQALREQRREGEE